MERKLTELEQIRRNKIEKLTQMGINPFSRDIDFSDNSKTLTQKYNQFTREQLEEKNHQASIIFRIMTMRGPFIVGKDAYGQVQAYAGKELDAQIQEIKNLLDIGDIVKIEGTVMKTKTGALTVKAKKINITTKSLKPLPEKFHGLKDVEERYRHRYVDLIMNDEVKQIFWTRTKIVSTIRQFMDSQGYMEADTPVLSPVLGGAAARPFTTHHNALDMEFYLRIATELPLKKLLVGGIEKVYEIGRLFRNEGIDTTHNPEFTSIEFYEAFSNLEGMMNRTEEVISHIAKKLDKEQIEYNGKLISLQAPFARLDMVKAVSEVVCQDMTKVSLEEAKEIAKKNKIEIKPYFTIGHIINELFEELVEATIVQPTFVTNHPVEVSPLAAVNEKDPRFTDRAELFIDGREYANMFTELNDPIDQLARFQNQIEEGKAGNDEASGIDMDFVEALEYGMPPAGGCGIGIDRLVMLFTGQSSIREVLLFPHLKNKPQIFKKENTNKKLFVFDMDGTLLNPEEKVLPETIEAIKEAKAKGHYTAIATGRPYSDIVRDLDQNLFDFLIANNGAYSYDVKNDNFDYYGEVPKELMQKVIAVGKEHNCFFAIHGEMTAERASLADHTEVDFNESDFVEFAKFKDSFLTEEEVLEFGNKQKIMQLSLRQNKETIANISTLFDDYKDIVDIHIANDVYLDINPKHVDKFKGIRHIVKLINQEVEIHAFGDSGNDLQMLRHADKSYCMGNGNAQAKQVATEVILPNSMPGIAKKIKEIIQ